MRGDQFVEMILLPLAGGFADRTVRLRSRGIERSNGNIVDQRSQIAPLPRRTRRPFGQLKPRRIPNPSAFRHFSAAGVPEPRQRA